MPNQISSKFPKKSIFHEPSFTNGDWRIFIDKSRKMLNDMLPRCTIQKEVSSQNVPIPNHSEAQRSHLWSCKVFFIFSTFIDKLHYNLLRHKKAIHAIADTHPTITCVGVHGTVNISIETSSPIFCCI